MDWALVIAAALVGLAGTPHCAAMCAAPCAAACQPGGQGDAGARWLAFQAGRCLSYSAAGAIAAASVAGLGAWAQFSAVLRPLWTLLIAGGLVLGLWLIWTGRHPRWSPGIVASSLAARPGWSPVRTPWTQNARPALLGALWAAWPCGLLQSALLVAAMASRPASGAAAMLAFGIASAPGLMLGIRGGSLMAWAKRRGWVADDIRAGTWAARSAGCALVAATLWTLGGPVAQRVWCVTP